MLILLIGVLIDPHGYIGDLTWTLIPGFIAGVSARLFVTPREPDNQSLKATQMHQGAAGASEKTGVVSQTNQSAATKRSSSIKSANGNQARAADNSTCHRDELHRISDCLDARDAGAIEQLVTKPMKITPGQQQQAAKLYVKTIEAIGQARVGQLLSKMFGGTPSYDEKQEETIRLIPSFLVDSGLNPNIQIDGVPLIHRAIKASNGGDAEDAVDPLINKGANVNSVNEDGLSALGAHLVHGCVSDNYRFEPYLAHGAKLNPVDLSNVKLYRTIMAYGLDNVFSAISDNDIMQFIKSTADPSGVFLLLAAVQGVRIESSEPAFLEKRRQQYERNPGYINIIKRLLGLGIDPNKSPEPGVPTAIELAMTLRHDKVADYLLQYAR